MSESITDILLFSGSIGIPFLILVLFITITGLAAWDAFQVMRSGTKKDIFLRIGSICIAGILYFLHGATWFLVLVVSDNGLINTLQEYEEADRFALFFPFHICSAILLLIFVVITWKKPRLWLRLFLVFMPALYVFFTRIHMIDTYGLAGCGDRTVLDAIADYVMGRVVDNTASMCF